MSETHVVFGTGPLGRAVMNALVAQGRSVRMINRNGRMEDVPPHRPVSADLQHRSGARRIADRFATHQFARPPVKVVRLAHHAGPIAEP
jgi:nucleoside-diphosphate-sugar epimerase